MSKKDYYQILGLEKTANDDQIKKAYRQLALKYHPDKADQKNKKEYEEKFKEISEAYRILSDKDKKAQYDHFGQTFEGSPSNGGFSQQDFSHFYDAFGSQDTFENLGFSRIFEEIFGFKASSRTNQAVAGQDIHLDMTITLAEAFSGLEKEIELNKLTVCSKCHGQGGQNFKKCQLCQGKGFQEERSQTFLGVIVQQKICQKCQGQGQYPEQTCHQCQGRGRIKEFKKIKIEIPAGIDNGQTIRLAGQGEAGPLHGTAGDLFITIHLKPDKHLERQDDNIIYQLAIDFTQAILGDKIEIPSLEGKIQLKIPAGTQPGEMIKLKGQGMPRLYDQGRGDMIVKIQVSMPKHLNRQQKKLIEELKQTEKTNAFSKFFS